MFGLLHAGFTVHLGLSQHVTGIGITLLAIALSSYTFRMILPLVTTPPKIVPFQVYPVPVLSDIPFIGPRGFYPNAAYLPGADSRSSRLVRPVQDTGGTGGPHGGRKPDCR